MTILLLDVAVRKSCAVMCLSPFETLGRETLWWIPGAVWVIKYLMGVK